jgi:Zn-dependent alcohol dehydrogenase
MKMKAAVLYQPGKPLVVEQVELDEPREGEVMVKMAGTGVCHTDLGVQEKGLLMPMVLGHEGAGIIHRLGPDVAGHKAGDHVVLTGAANCGRCPTCRRGPPVMCETYRPYYFNGYLPGKQTRLHTAKGQPIYHFFIQSSFAEYAVVPADNAIKVRPDAPLDTVGVLGCGASTGLGAVINKLNPEVGSSIAVFGCGGVGMSAIMGARLCGAGTIIGVDVLDSKLKAAVDFGATHVINSRKEDAVARIRQITGGGADGSVMAVGSTDIIGPAFDSIRYGGTCVVVGAPPDGGKAGVDFGSSMGSGRAAIDIPAWVDLFMQGRLPLDRLVSRRYPLDDINSAFEMLARGDVIKPLISF